MCTVLAAFGAEIHDPILGYVIPLSSFTTPCASNSSLLFPEENSGCPFLCINGPNQPTESWIALVQRGKCEFVKKVRQAQWLGARAVVVGGENPDVSGYPDTLVNMYSPGTCVTFWTMIKFIHDQSEQNIPQM
jgi:E3 ubiquitin-protein ligase RNF13/E3 ubiquitin-protein ligase RNF167